MRSVVCVTERFDVWGEKEYRMRGKASVECVKTREFVWEQEM